jgi:hypothetical protein
MLFIYNILYHNNYLFTIEIKKKCKYLHEKEKNMDILGARLGSSSTPEPFVFKFLDCEESILGGNCFR